ncbi:MAG TPA: hypothetical protein GXZ58_04445 [Bacilli bacterium]|nr:hypothetical protein [Bacilli bacterium]
MANTNQVKQFKLQIVQLNKQLIQIEKRIAMNSDYIVCANHEKYVTQILKYYDKLALSV